MNSDESGGSAGENLLMDFLRGRWEIAQLLRAQAFGKLGRVGIDKRSEIAHRIGRIEGSTTACPASASALFLADDQNKR